MKRRARPGYAYTLIGFNYVLINLPLLIFGKVGYSKTYKGVKNRAKSTSKPAPGIMFPIMICLLPMPWFVEQLIHSCLSDFQFSFYKGDGHTETYNIIGVVIAWVIYACINLGYLEVAHRYGIVPFGAHEVLQFVIIFF